MPRGHVPGNDVFQGILPRRNRRPDLAAALVVLLLFFFLFRFITLHHRNSKDFQVLVFVLLVIVQIAWRLRSAALGLAASFRASFRPALASAGPSTSSTTGSRLSAFFARFLRLGMLRSIFQVEAAVVLEVGIPAVA